MLKCLCPQAATGKVHCWQDTHLRCRVAGSGCSSGLIEALVVEGHADQAAYEAPCPRALKAMHAKTAMVLVAFLRLNLPSHTL